MTRLDELIAEFIAEDGALNFHDTEHLARLLLEERAELRPVVTAARIALDVCRRDMRLLVEKGVRHPATKAGADQFAAAWRDLRTAVEAAEGASDARI